MGRLGVSSVQHTVNRADGIGGVVSRRQNRSSGDRLDTRAKETVASRHDVNLDATGLG